MPAYRLVNTCQQGQLPHRKGDPQPIPRATSSCSASRFVPLQGSAGRLSPVRAAGAAPGQSRQRQHRLGRRLQGRADAVRPARRRRAGAGLLGALAARARPASSASPTAGRTCRSTTGCSGPTTAPKTATSPSPARSIWPPAAANSCWPSASGSNAAEAGHRALASLRYGFDAASEAIHRATGRTGSEACSTCWRRLRLRPSGRDLYRVSTAVLRTHEAKRFPGGLIASLSIPWGFNKGDEDLGGYHLVWPRDLVEAAGGLLAWVRDDAPSRAPLPAGHPGSRRHWPQNMWLDGTPYWTASRWTRPPFRSCWSDMAAPRSGASSRTSSWALWPHGAQGGVASSCATARSRSRTAGRKIPATRRSPWPWSDRRAARRRRHRRCSSASRPSQTTSAKRPTPGTTASSAGPM